MGSMPYMPFYIGDWKKSPEIGALSLSARGLWLELLLLMWESPKRGILLLESGQTPTNKMLGRMVGSNQKEITKVIKELKKLRRLISAIVLAYIELYGTTELIS